MNRRVRRSYGLIRMSQRRLVLKAKLAAEQAKSELTYVRNKLDNTRLIAQMVLHAPPSSASYDNWAAGPMD